MDSVENLLLQRPARGGCVGHLSDGRVCFVRHGLPGESVTVRITESKSRFARGDVVDVLSASENRVTPPCAYAHVGGCGGCDLQHVATTAHSEWKARVASEQFSRIAKLDMEIAVSDASSASRSRTRLRCGVDSDGRLGLRRHGSDVIQPLVDCWLMDSSVNEAFLNDWTGAREVELRSIGETSFAVVTLASGEVVTATLDGLIDDDLQRSHVEVLGERFRVSPQSFWQSHADAPATLTRAVLSAARVRRGDRVVDLFSGVGLFSVPLARHAGHDGRVIAVEASASACADARRNVADVPQVTVVESRVTPRVIRDVVDARSIVVLDPPRAGAGIENMSALLHANPLRVVYVSCDAATLARDAKVLVDGGWTLASLSAFDLFPMTEHLELVATFSRSTR